MEEIVQKALSEAIHQVPGLVILAVLVWMFIKVIMRFIKHIEDRGRIMQQFNREHLDAREQDRQAIHRSNKAIEDNTAAIRNLTLVVERMRNNNRHER